MSFNRLTVINNFLSKETCKLLLKKYKTQLELTPGTVDNGTKTDIRRSSVGFIQNIEELDTKLKEVLKEKITIKGGQVTGLGPYQFTEYKQGDFFDWHTDSNDTDYRHRFCSIVIQLNDCYTGGNLQINNEDNKPIPIQEGVGNLYIFHSDLLHRVTKVEKGVRYSLVNWVSFKPLKTYKKTLI